MRTKAPRRRQGARAPAKTKSARSATAREVAAEVVDAVLRRGAFAGPALDAALKAAALDDRDRGFCTELALGTLRWAGPLEASLLRGADKPGRGLDKRLRPHLLVAAYQLQHLDDRIPSHAAVSEAMKIVARVRPGLRGFSNALLRKLGSPLHLLLKPDASLDEVATAYGIPMAVAKATTDGLSSTEMRDAIAALNARPPLSLAILEDDNARVIDDINAQQPEVERHFTPHPFVAGVFVAHGAGAPERFPGFSEGQFVVQDPGSRLVAQLAGTPRGAHVVDLCAAPGTKTVGLAMAAGIRGSVTAVDVDDRRLKLVAEASERVAKRGAKIVPVATDARVFAADRENREAFDVVLLDAPCSALGTTRRHPEVSLRRTDEDIAANAQLQWEILDAALALVAPGGTLVYAVCSPLPEEGRAHLERLVAAGHAHFSVTAANQVLSALPDDAVDDLGALRLRPHLHHADAFYAFRLDKAAAASGS